VKSYLGTYSLPGAEANEATVLVFDKEVHIGYRSASGHHQTLKWNITDVEAVFDLASQSTRIRNRTDRTIEILVNGKDAAGYLSTLQAEQQKPWHQKDKAREWGRNSLIFLGVAGGLVLLYFLLVPWMAEKMASQVSVKTEEGFGDAAYTGMRLEEQEDTAASFAINHFFTAMNVRTAYNIRITVVKGETVNAFALPGGRIVVYTALLDAIETYPELAALLAHEFTHVNNKHSTKAIFRKLGSKIFISLLLGKFGSVTSVLVDQADNLKSLTYSRSLEKEADMDGLELLKARKIDTKGFTDLFQHLKNAGPSSSAPEFLGSHPDIDKRIDYIYKAAIGAVVAENTELRTIFEKLKQTIQ